MQELAYSIHLGSDKNRSKLGKRVAQNNPSDTTSLSNNAIQNSQQLSKVNKHNLRNYDKKIEDIEVVYGTNDLYQDVKNVYLQEFQEAQIEYDNKVRKDRRIGDYFIHISCAPRLPPSFQSFTDVLVGVSSLLPANNCVGSISYTFIEGVT